MKRIGLFALFAAALFAQNCSRTTENEMIKKARASLRLADGSSISQPGTDDYAPTLLLKDDGHLILIFGSNRSYAGQTSSNKHNLFITESVAPFVPFAPVPYFQPVQVLKSASQALDQTGRIHFVARYSSSQQKVMLAFTDNSNFQIKLTGITDANIGTGTMDSITNFQGPGVGVNRVGTILGAYEQPDDTAMIAYRAQNNSIIVASPEATLPTTDASLTNQQITADSSLAMFPEWIAGANSYFYTNWNSNGTDGGEVLAAQGDQPTGAPGPLNEALAEAGIKVGEIRPFYSFSSPFSGMTFSAGETLNGNHDLYVITSHDMFALWAMTFEDPLFIPGDFFQDTPPQVAFAYTLLDNTAIELFFDQPVWADAGQSSPLTTGSFSVTFVQNGGTATNATLTAVQQLTGSAPVGGEPAYKLVLSITGTPNGNEYVVIAPQSSTSIYSFTGQAMDVGATYVAFLNPPPPAPTIIGGFMLANTHVVVNFDMGVYSDAGASQPVTTADFNLTYNSNGGCGGCTVGMSSVTRIDDSPLTGGETMVKVVLSISGTLTGLESVVITPASGAAIYNVAGTAMGAAETTSDVFFIAPPGFMSTNLNGANTYIDVDFDEPVWGDNSASSPVTLTSFTIDFVANGGCACSVSITSATLLDGNSLGGGEGSIRLHLNISGGSPTGLETISVRPANGSSVYNFDGIAMSASEATTPVNLNAAGSGPNILSTTVSADNSYVVITFDTAVYGDAGSTTPVQSSAFQSVLFTGGSGCTACAPVNITGVQLPGGGALVGGETAIRVNLLYQAPGPFNGTETVELRLFGSAVFAGGIAAPNNTSTGVKNLNVFGGGGNKKIFITAGTFNGNLGGAAGADTICNGDGNKPNGSNYKALIVQTGTRDTVTDWPLLANTSYDRAAGGLIGMTDGAKTFPFPLNGGGFGTGTVWTGMTTTWNIDASNQCINWTYSLAGGNGTVGDAIQLNGASISNGTNACNSVNRLICVEQ